MSLVIVSQKIEAANRTLVAREIGVSRPHVSLILSGKTEPSFPTAAKLARALRVSLDDFYEVWESRRAA